jgi:hypothetical protein
MTGGERRLFKDHTTDVTKIIRSLFFIHVVACFGRERPSAGSTTAGCSEGERASVCYITSYLPLGRFAKPSLWSRSGARLEASLSLAGCLRVATCLHCSRAKYLDHLANRINAR